MEIAILSDIHAEFYKRIPNWLPPLPSNADVLVLGGDIHVGAALIDFVIRISEALPKTHLIVIAGNHEFYGQHREKTLVLYRQAFLDHPLIHFLENDLVDIDGVRFIGATLWTGFPLFDERFTQQEVMSYAKECLSDFHYISDDSNPGSVKTFSPEDAAGLFHKSISAIDKMLENSDPERTVVVTHFPPLQVLRHPTFPIDQLSSYFTADCSEVASKYGPAYWIYGHNHWSNSVEIGGTTFISNQFGYPNERRESGGSFDPDMTIQIDTGD